MQAGSPRSQLMGYLALCLLLLLLLFILELRPVLVSHAASLCEEGDGWALDWAEDFAGDALNLTRWSVHTGSGDSLARLSTATHENVYVQGGRLVLRSRRETANVSIAGQVYNYSTGAVTSLGKVSFAKGPSARPHAEWQESHGPFIYTDVVFHGLDSLYG